MDGKDIAIIITIIIAVTLGIIDKWVARKPFYTEELKGNSSENEDVCGKIQSENSIKQEEKIQNIVKASYYSLLHETSETTSYSVIYAPGDEVIKKKCTSMIKVQCGDKEKLYQVVSEDFDTYLVLSDYKNKSIRYRNKDRDEFCKLIRKEDVTARYDEWMSHDDLYKGVKVFCEEAEGKIKISSHEGNIPDDIKNSFSYEKCVIDRGDDYPKAEYERYYKFIQKDDSDLQRNKYDYFHREYSINLCKTLPNISAEDRKELRNQYLAEKIQRFNGWENPYYALLTGAYGFGCFDSDGMIDYDTIFETIIPAAYSIAGEEPWTDGKFRRELSSIMFYDNPGFCAPFNHKYTVLIGDRDVELSREFRYFLYLQRCIRVKRYRERGIAPYTILDLKNVWYWYKKQGRKYSYEDYENNHNPVIFNGAVVCDDLGKFAKMVGREMEYYKQFDLKNA